MFPHYKLINKYSIAITHELPQKIFYELLDFNSAKHQGEKLSFLLNWSKSLTKKIEQLVPKLIDGRKQGIYLLED